MFKVYIKRYKTKAGRERFSFYSELTGKIITVGIHFLPNCFVYTGDAFYLLSRQDMEYLFWAYESERRYWEFRKNFINFRNVTSYRAIRHSKTKKRQRLSY